MAQQRTGAPRAAKGRAVNDTDVIAWHLCGAVFCPDCKPAAHVREGEPHPVFADSADDENGATCDTCSACFVDGEWLDQNDAVGPDVRWTRCDYCNAQKPHHMREATGGTYRKTRIAIRRGTHACESCGKRGTVRFI